MKITIKQAHQDGRQKPVITIDTKSCHYPYAIRAALRQALILDGITEETADEVFNESKVVPVCENPMSEEDRELLKVYKAGWMFGLYGGTTYLMPEGEFKIAFSKGISDSITGDDVSSTDYRSEEEILEDIHSSVKTEKSLVDVFKENKHAYKGGPETFMEQLERQSLELLQNAFEKAVVGNGYEKAIGCPILKEPLFQKYTTILSGKDYFAVKVDNLEIAKSVAEVLPGVYKTAYPTNTEEDEITDVLSILDSNREFITDVVKGQWLVVPEACTANSFSVFNDKDFHENFLKVE